MVLKPGEIWSASRPPPPRGPRGYYLAAATLLIAAFVSNLISWAPFARAHFSSCTSPLVCSGGVGSLSTIPIASGGTGQTGQQAALDALVGYTVKGSLMVGNGSDNVQLAVGTNGMFLKADSTDAEGVIYSKVDLADTTNVTGVLADGNVADTITASNYLPLNGGTMLGSIQLDNLGIQGDPSDTNPSCSGSAYHIYADLSENKWKKCQNGVASDLDTAGGTVTVPAMVQTTGMDLNANSIFFNPASGMLCSTEADCTHQFSASTTISNLRARANKDIGGTNHTIELATGSCTSGITLDCGAGDACVTVPSSSSTTPTAADTDGLSVTGGNCVVGKITATGNTNADVIHAISWTVTAS